MSGLVLLGLHGVEQLLELCHGLGNLRLHPAVRQVREACVADHVARVACNHEAAGVPLVCGQGQLRRELIMMSSHWCAPPSRSRKTRALWLPSSRSSGPLSDAALLLEICSLLQPAQFFVRKRSSEKSEVLVTVSVLDTKSCGAETVPELVTSPHTTLPVDTPPLVAVKVQSRLSQSSRPTEAAPVMVSVAPVNAPWLTKLAAVAAPEAVRVPVDTSPTVVKFPALAVLLMVRVLPVIPVAELSRPTLAAPVMLSELPDTAPVDDSVAPDTVPVAVSVAQETAENVRAVHVVAQQLVVVDVVGLRHVHHEVGGRAEPVPAFEEELSAGRQVVGAHDVPRVHCQGQGVAVHARCAHGVRGQDHAAAAAGANRPV